MRYKYFLFNLLYKKNFNVDMFFWKISYVLFCCCLIYMFRIFGGKGVVGILMIYGIVLLY